MALVCWTRVGLNHPNNGCQTLSSTYEFPGPWNHVTQYILRSFNLGGDIGLLSIDWVALSSQIVDFLLGGHSTRMRVRHKLNIVHIYVNLSKFIVVILLNNFFTKVELLP